MTRDTKEIICFRIRLLSNSTISASLFEFLQCIFKSAATATQTINRIKNYMLQTLSPPNLAH